MPSLLFLNALIPPSAGEEGQASRSYAEQELVYAMESVVGMAQQVSKMERREKQEIIEEGLFPWLRSYKMQ